MRKKKILQICRLTPLWGMDLFHAISHAFCPQTTEVTTVFLAGETQPHLKNTYQGTVLFFNLNRHRPWWRWQAWRKLRTLCKKNYFDIVICHHYKPTLLMHWVALTTGVGKLFSMHHNFGNFTRPSQRWWLHQFKKRWQFITVSSALKQELLHHQLHPRQINVIPNTILIEKLRMQQLSQQSARKICGLSEQSIIFGTLGRLVEDKNPLLLIAAFNQLLQQIPQYHDLHLVIIGTGPLAEVIQKTINQSPFSAQLHLITTIAPQGAHYLRAFDVFVLPSQQEAFGIVLLEAMCAELPLIATHIGGIPEAAGPHATLVPPHNIAALTQALKSYAMMPQTQRLFLGKKNYTYLQENFSLLHYQQRFRELAVEEKNIERPT